MLTRDDLLDIVIAGLAKAKPAPSAPARRRPGLPPPGPKGRPFWSEHDLRKALTGGGKRLTLPADAIVSPLASDWLTLKGIEIIRS